MTKPIVSGEPLGVIRAPSNSETIEWRRDTARGTSGIMTPTPWLDEHDQHRPTRLCPNYGGGYDDSP
jgi:hypothetical protein